MEEKSKVFVIDDVKVLKELIWRENVTEIVFYDEDGTQKHFVDASQKIDKEPEVFFI